MSITKKRTDNELNFVNSHDDTALIIACKYSTNAASHLLNWKGMSRKLLSFSSYNENVIKSYTNNTDLI